MAFDRKRLSITIQIALALALALALVYRGQQNAREARPAIASPSAPASPR